MGVGLRVLLGVGLRVLLGSGFGVLVGLGFNVEARMIPPRPPQGQKCAAQIIRVPRDPLTPGFGV